MSTPSTVAPAPAAPVLGRARLATYSFALTCFCFLLPFLTISCGGLSMTLSGVQTITGASTEELGEQAQSAASRVEGSLATGFAACCAVFGLLLTLREPHRTQHKVAATAAALGALSLVLFQASAEIAATTQGMGLIRLKFGVGYWLSLLGLVGAGVALIAALRQGRATEASPHETPSLAASSGGAP